MPQLSPLKWLNLYIIIILMSILIIIKMNFFFLNKMNQKKNNKMNKIHQLKWKI
uniref:ATP synthase F0 subunit 8 n=3 Tax=Vespa velutina TaxID=202808 RepID=A0A347YEJ3_VESVE|nr:ATP synthase F0 subunit 8 [Vespa velutina]AQT19230.1 ATP synthase F0 subunit 8 [Vespa velutina nigrithorax]QKG04144.1 ATP synthase F0 subunit 8 [Vespa velutina auraria]BAX73953.2 ATP synthase F0 subunit 8 [Vespa velutina]BBC27611.1 ATP synthase F0 subunit 8 [Vespa velutina]BBC27624.1 ATP synthase F0 subunit 8 [Vespa velutina]